MKLERPAPQGRVPDVAAVERMTKPAAARP